MTRRLDKYMQCLMILLIQEINTRDFVKFIFHTNFSLKLKARINKKMFDNNECKLKTFLLITTKRLTTQHHDSKSIRQKATRQK